MTKSQKTGKKDKLALRDTVQKGLRSKGQATKPRKARSKKVSASSGSESNLDIHKANWCGLPALPDELLLEIISYLPSAIPKVTSSLGRESRGSGFIRREVLLNLSLLCRNLRRFALPYTFETIEVYTGTRVVCDVKKSIFLGGPRDNYGMNKQFALELLRQLDFVTNKHPELKVKVRSVFVELRGHRLEEVSEELFRCLPLFPNLNAIRLEAILPTMYYDVRHTSKAQIDPAIYSRLSLPSVHTLLISTPLTKLVTTCPNLKHLRVFGYNEDPPYLNLANQRLGIETVFIRNAEPSLLNFVNLRKIIIADTTTATWNAVMSHHMLPFLQYPNLPRLQTIHIVVDFRITRATNVAPLLKLLEEDFRTRQALMQEDKFICVEYRYPRLRRDYVQLKVDGTRETNLDAALIRHMF